jgi:hypothetical protein
MSAGYRPFEDGPFRLSMGLLALKPEEWLEIDGDLAADIEEKRRLLTTQRGNVFAELPVSEAAQREVLKLLADHLAADHPQHYRRSGSHLECLTTGETVDLSNPGRPALEAAACMVQEDLCLLHEQDGAYILSAACVCFPSRWKLRDKIGKPLSAIHDPVPGYDAKLARPVDRFFHVLKADKPVWRLNWSIVDDPALYQPTGHGSQGDPSITAATAGEKLWLRVERQTLRRLPVSGDVLFTIRIHRTPLRQVAAAPEQAKRLAQAIEVMPPDYQGYKTILPYREILLTYLNEAATLASHAPQART